MQKRMEEEFPRQSDISARNSPSVSKLPLQFCTVPENPIAFLLSNAFIILKLLKPSLSMERKDYPVKFEDIKLGGR